MCEDKKHPCQELSWQTSTGSPPQPKASSADKVYLAVMSQRGISLTTSLSAVLVAIVIALGAYAVLGSGAYAVGRDTSATSLIVSSSSSLSYVSLLITFNADAYNAEVQALLNGFTGASGIPVAPTHSAGSFALARQISSGSQVDVFIPV